MRLFIGFPLLFVGLYSTALLVAECLYGDHNCLLELLVVTVPLAWIGHVLMRRYAKPEKEVAEAGSLEGQHERETASSHGSTIAYGGLRARKWIVSVCYLIVVGAVSILIANAVANPDSLRLRIEVNEETAIRDVQAVLAAETAYAPSNSGYYVQLECLVRPAQCNPLYPPGKPALLSEPLDGLRRGYVREFVPGPPASADAPSPSSLQSYAFIAYPEDAESGVRSFCGDSAGNFCFTLGGPQALALDGECARKCLPLE
jgi:hypothetical protein